MDKKKCFNCGKDVNFFTKVDFQNGVACNNCVDIYKLPMKERMKVAFMTTGEVATRFGLQRLNFSPTKEISNKVKFDDKNRKLFIYPGEIIAYDDISGYELLEDGDAIASGGLGRAAVGGVLFGGAGAVVGAVTGNRKGNCRSLQIKLTVDRSGKSTAYITFIDKKIKKGSKEYEKDFKDAQECLSKLELITEHESTNTSGAADEIKKYKELLDAEAITEEEYNQKKKELLGL